MSEWKCGKCGHVYSFDEFMKLEHIKAVESDDNPKRQHGFIPVCKKCGYVFHKDKFRLMNTVEIKFNNEKEKVSISTIFLELNHFGFWYETMIFPSGKVNCGYQDRFVTKKEAKENHKKIVKLLKDGKFIVDNSYELNLLFDEE